MIYSFACDTSRMWIETDLKNRTRCNDYRTSWICQRTKRVRSHMACQAKSPRASTNEGELQDATFLLVTRRWQVPKNCGFAIRKSTKKVHRFFFPRKHLSKTPSKGLDASRQIGNVCGGGCGVNSWRVKTSFDSPQASDSSDWDRVGSDTLKFEAFCHLRERVENCFIDRCEGECEAFRMPWGM